MRDDLANKPFVKSIVVGDDGVCAHDYVGDAAGVDALAAHHRVGGDVHRDGVKRAAAAGVVKALVVRDFAEQFAGGRDREQLGGDFDDAVAGGLQAGGFGLDDGDVDRLGRGRERVSERGIA